MTQEEATLDGAEPLVQAAKFATLVLSGHTLSGLMGQSPQAHEALYGTGRALYQQGRYPDAMKVFAYLLVHNHLDARYYRAFAASLQMQERYAEALKYYTIASVLDLTDPAPPIYMAQCHLALNNRGKARECLEYAVAQARAQERHKAHLDRAQALLALIDGPDMNNERSIPQ